MKHIMRRHGILTTNESAGLQAFASRHGWNYRELHASPGLITATSTGGDTERIDTDRLPDLWGTSTSISRVSRRTESSLQALNKYATLKPCASIPSSAIESTIEKPHKLITELVGRHTPAVVELGTGTTGSIGSGLAGATLKFHHRNGDSMHTWTSNRTAPAMLRALQAQHLSAGSGESSLGWTARQLLRLAGKAMVHTKLAGDSKGGEFEGSAPLDTWLLGGAVGKVPPSHIARKMVRQDRVVSRPVPTEARLGEVLCYALLRNKAISLTTMYRPGWYDQGISPAPSETPLDLGLPSGSDRTYHTEAASDLARLCASILQCNGLPSLARSIVEGNVSPSGRASGQVSPVRQLACHHGGNANVSAYVEYLALGSS